MLTSKKTLPTATHNRYTIWRLCYILVFGLLISSVLLTGYFIYQTIYIGIANSNAIIATNATLHTYSLDIATYTKSLIAIQQKRQLEGFSKSSRNIFDFSKTTSTYESTSTRP